MRHLNILNKGLLLKIRIFCLIFFFSFGITKEAGELYQKALKYYSQKEFSKAEELFQKALENTNPKHKIYFYLGNINTIKKEYKTAGEYYQKAIEKGSGNNSIYYNNYGDLYYIQEMYDVASEMYKKSMKIKPTPHGAFNLGLAYFREDKFRDSADTFERFLKIMPDYSKRSKVERLIRLLRDKKGEEAEETVQKISKGGSGEEDASDSDSLESSMEPVNINDIKNNSKEMETKSGESIDDIEMDMDIVE